MTSQHESTGIAALDELGHRFDAVSEHPRIRRLRPRRWAALSLGILALAATPAIAAVAGVFDGAERVEDALPQVGAAIDRADPTATGRALERQGFRVRWMLITDNPGREGGRPTRSRVVGAPPVGTEILSVLNEQGGLAVDSNTRDLQIEIAPADSAILAGHR